ncbi:hypothetical protein [Synechocystis salina]|uniref:hypothetical protein n=1 Tax=Synechocystis salina TaxID=945780 RepID=UPI001D136705|nr:hypothetical protein [Synechocystis salina]
MQNFSFQKVLKKPEVKTLLQRLDGSVGKNFAIIDTNGLCLWGNAQGSEAKADIYAHQVCLGTVNGDLESDSAEAIAAVVGYIVQTEYEKSS